MTWVSEVGTRILLLFTTINTFFATILVLHVQVQGGRRVASLMLLRPTRTMERWSGVDTRALTL